MKAAQLVAPKRFTMVEVPMPAPRDGECLVRLEAVSICGSDIRQVYDVVHPEEAYPMAPGRPGHECVGTVVESRDEGVREGQRVIVLPLNMGGLQEYVAAPASRLVPVPQNGSPEAWVMCQPLGTVLYACARLGSLLGKTVAVVGQGAIGLAFTMVLERLGAERIIGLDLLDYRLEWSRRMGATHTVNPMRVNAQEALDELTGGRRADIVVEAAGMPDAVNLALSLARLEGTVLCFGLAREFRIPMDHEALVHRLLTVIGTSSARSAAPAEGVRQMVRLVERGWLDPSRLITHRMGLGEVQRAYDMYTNYEDRIIKVVMTV